MLSSALVEWCHDYEAVLDRVRLISERSQGLTSATLMHAAAWECEVTSALTLRFPSLDPVAAQLGGVVAMGSLRLARGRMLANSTRLGEEVAVVISAVQLL